MTEKTGRLEGKMAILTGGASGIGLACGRAFVAEGARVAIVDRDPSALEDAIASLGSSATGYMADVTSLETAASTLASIESASGSCDVLLTAAGISRGLLLVDTTEEVWDEVFAINAKGTFAWMRAALPGMIERRQGSIITVASQLAFAGGRANAAYIASKGAIVSLTRTAAFENAEYGVRVNALVPGATVTPLLERSMARNTDPEAAREASRNRLAMKRLGRPENLAAGALYLASDESEWVTGTELVIDGGWLVA